MAKNKSVNIALCPECDGPVNLSGKLHVGQKLLCRRCGSVLMITDHKSLELVSAYNQRPYKGQVKEEKRKSNNAGSTQKSIEEDFQYVEDPNMSSKTRVYTAECPECDARIPFRKPLKLGHLMLCAECNELLEVVSLRPIELSWAAEAPRDFDNYDDFDDLQYSSRYGIS